MSGGLDSTTYDLDNAVCGLFWTGLAGVKPGDDGFDGEDGNQLGSPVQPRPGRRSAGNLPWLPRPWRRYCGSAARAAVASFVMPGPARRQDPAR